MLHPARSPLANCAEDGGAALDSWFPAKISVLSGSVSKHLVPASRRIPSMRVSLREVEQSLVTQYHRLIRVISDQLLPFEFCTNIVAQVIPSARVTI